DVNITILTDAMNASQPLFKTRRIPRHVVVDHQPAELEIYAFARGFCRDADLPAGAEVLLRPLTFVRIHPAVNFACRVAPGGQVFEQVGEGIAMFSENEELTSAVRQLVELGLGEAFPKSCELRILGVIANATGLSK